MKNYDVIVIGGSAAGATAALTTRKHYPGKSVLMIKNVKNVPIPCGIPYIFGTVGDPLKNLLPTDTMMASNGVDVVQDEATKINREFKLVMTASGEGYTYAKLIVATGSNPIVPPIVGHDLANVFPIVKDAEYLKNMLETCRKADDFVIVGGGFIGVEMAEELKKLRPTANVTVVEMQAHCLQVVYDQDFCAIAEKALTDQGILLLTNETVAAIRGEGKAETVVLASGKSVKADVVVLGIGCTPNVRLAEEAGLKIGPARGILVNRQMMTSDDAIYACGDCADKVSFFDKKPSGMRLASIATAEARIAGANLFTARRVNDGVVGVFSTAIGKKTFAAAGLTEREAVQKGYRVVAAESEAVNRHPGSLPGAEPLKVRLLFETGSGLLLGGEVFGAVSGGELINVVGALIAKRTTADEIVLFQAGTHPLLTASPIAYQLVNAAESAIVKMNRYV
ncbi:MAG: FAD-dependent oxidoreductase [Candidatus Izemoplasmatales bacterium]